MKADLIFLEPNDYIIEEIERIVQKQKLTSLYLFKSKTPPSRTAIPHKLLPDLSYETLANFFLLEKSIPPVVPFTCENTIIASKINFSKKGSKTGPPISASKICTDKLKFRNALKGKNYNIDYCATNNTLDVKHFTERNKFPIIIKPAKGSSSKGVIKINTPHELKNYSFTKEHLMEQFIKGHEFSAEIIVLDKEIIIAGICSKDKMANKSFEEIGYSHPAPFIDIDSLKTADLYDAVRSLNIKNSIIHAEFILHKGHIKIIEFNLRIGGGGLSHKLLKHSSTHNLLESMLLSIYLERPFAKSSQNIFKYCYLYLYQIGSGGKIKTLPNPKNLSNQNLILIEEYSKYKKGDLIQGYPHYSGLPGYAIFGANQLDTLKNSLNKKSKDLLIKYE